MAVIKRNVLQNDLNDVPPGWVRLVATLEKALHKRNAKIVQAKQKFGRLRVYTTFDADPGIKALTGLAAAWSAFICDQCANAGTLVEMRTLCSSCRASGA